MSKAYDVMIAGHLCVDLIPRFLDTGAKQIGEIMRPGKLVNVEDVIISTGGPVSNTGINMKVLGSKVCFCARIGDDVLGELTIAMLRSTGNADGIHVVKGGTSSYTIVLAPPNIDRIFLHHPGTNNEFGPEDLNPELIGQCKHFHFGYPPLMRRMYQNDGSSLEQLFKIAKETGATTSCDMTLPDPFSESGKANWRKILQKILPFVDIFVPSIEESYYMIDPKGFLKRKTDHNDSELIDYFTADDYSRIADELLSMGTKITTLKSGHRGFYIKTGPKREFKDMGEARPSDGDNWACRELWAPAYVVEKLASATGSGDSAVAGFLSAMLKGLTIEEALKYATCCGWQNVLVLDAVSGIHSWDETTEMIKRKMPMIDIHMNSDGWTWSDKYGLWAGPGDLLR